MAGLSKSRLIAHLQCPKRLWLQMNKPELMEVDASQQARMDAATSRPPASAAGYLRPPTYTESR